jgi:6-pyruvoyltetrahydropterin/6-carboxytetrahydropterin synthase
MRITATREHEIACGHRVVGHEGKCRNIHGHNYLFTFHCEAQALDHLGRVIDFSVIKDRLCLWLERYWDHRTLLWVNDEQAGAFQQLDPTVTTVPFNPTAENIADYMLNVIGPKQLEGTGVQLVKVTVGETRKCSASAEL